jgi:putative transposase
MDALAFRLMAQRTAIKARLAGGYRLRVPAQGFRSLQPSRTFLDEFVQHYNHEHHHTGIGLHTPADVHYCLAEAVTERHVQTLAQARADNPQRFNSNVEPKILDLPNAAWINPPVDQLQEAAEPAAA